VLSRRSDALYLQFRQRTSDRLEGRLGDHPAMRTSAMTAKRGTDARIDRLGRHRAMRRRGQRPRIAPLRYGSTRRARISTAGTTTAIFGATAISPGNFAADPFGAGFGAAGLFGSTPWHSAQSPIRRR